ncbi:hypothetical protein FB45DRAFT_892670 [Roridomyces roridus]|uniref:Uncharacterized protein n=1 Tax=Roridomyces roridus TaxID=1738132 RepID=A0AAD7CFG0_9AGAR|nr:hypothetical protein FB45DRAFT_892670 [Roridomyces roridus]
MEEHPSHNEKLKEKRAAYPSNNEKLEEERAAPPSKNKKKVKESNADRRKRLVLLCSQSHRDQDARNKVLAAERAETYRSSEACPCLSTLTTGLGPVDPSSCPRKTHIASESSHQKTAPQALRIPEPPHLPKTSQTRPTGPVEALRITYILVSERSPPATRNHAIEYLRESLRACNAPNPDLTQHDPVFLQGLRECQAIVDSALYKIPVCLLFLICYPVELSQELKDYLRPPPT